MKNHTEVSRFQRRSIVCAIIVFILFFLLVLRLIYLQIIEHRFYNTLSERNVINVIPVTPNRGIIYDRTGVVLAKNLPVYSLMITTARVKNVNATLEALKTVVNLTPEEIKTFERIRNQYYPYQAIPLKKALTEAEVDRFYIEQYRFPGVTAQTNMIRSYPLGATLSGAVGYVGRITAKEFAEVDPSNYSASDDIGKAGVEAEDEVLLHGKTGSEQAEIDANGKVVRILKMKPATPGDNLYLTIDSKLQTYAEKLLGDNSGAIVAIQPSTGQVLALVTKPNYDPNIFSGRMSQAQYKAIMFNPDHPLFNRATRGLYAPGSTIKPFISFYALDNHVIDTQDYIFDPGWFQLPRTQHIYHNWTWNLHHTGAGWVNVTKAIMTSCDTFFYQLAVVLGIDRLDEALTQFGFGQLTGINLPLELKGVVPSPSWKEAHIGHPWYEGDTVITGIGQGFTLVTPLQLANAVATMANRGQRIQPTVLLKIQQPSGTTTEMQPILESAINAKDPKAWDIVIQAMESVITNPQGTAYHYWGKQASYTVAAKTGTAQVVREKKDAHIPQNETPFKERDNHWFVAFAPTDHPQIALAIIVEHNPIAVQIGRQILDFYMDELKQQAQPKTATPNATLPAPTSEQNTVALPAPEGAAKIQEDLQDDLQQEMRLQQVDHPPTPEQLQQQMDSNLNEEVDMSASPEKDEEDTSENDNKADSSTAGSAGFQKIAPAPNSHSAAPTTPPSDSNSAVPITQNTEPVNPPTSPPPNNAPTPAVINTNNASDLRSSKNKDPDQNTDAGAPNQNADPENQ
ncbi:MAG: penicillin-binding protein 2 [Coxiellaceae bacterium]|nr:penicillin-binding protein 2 [Coxiellaceae bacterium]